MITGRVVGLIKEVKFQNSLQPANLENSAVATGLEKVSFHSQFSFQSQRKARPKNVQTTEKLHSSHRLAK